ncbi:MAG TPA: PDDEXK nuclease domain-containing protein [Syntrophorhabdaceae bacterium]|nr:PDDEXK nuclease domain-containing protein [Syntrophorhabdaceae bacterium]HOL04684.1 PDDEXK nuclease domain-containing protein [Syntrophorhabdaceae bacterium]HON85187.1 PDDEXK nuclease domain-containing protein [Syntrophorhabdaceae bacterium]HOT42634.1 PDDEXK nuclease domain-containing protein [Syntrophorhabdaceae bacterium]HPC66118.1 PDDEXK nuclease domain-containing protein [Syntrophorhabdaceae bacterium]
MGSDKGKIDFQRLVSTIAEIDRQLFAQAGKAVNVSLTLRNWFIGLHIAEYELHGSDRAKYGENLLNELSQELRMKGISNTGRRQLYNYLSFYRVYPQIVRTLPAQLRYLLPAPVSKIQKVRTLSAQLTLRPKDLLTKFSYSHLELLVSIDDPLKRAFYEIECLRGNWSVRELKRQMVSLYYERSGLSRDKKKLAELVHAGAEVADPRLEIRDPYVFEFLGIKSKEVMAESDLEDALLDKIQDFLLELGHGFCFEARQKRILIGKKLVYIDLVFYHRILKCHVLIELKVDEFKHEHLGQLNTYVSWYRKNMMADGDNLPIGILLCTQKDHTLVEYALAGMDNRLFVSKYQLELPKKDEMERFLEEQMKEIGYGEYC